MDPRPIGVFDSGLGGLTAVKQLISLLPEEDIVYFGDTGRVPYGTRSCETITEYALSDLRFLLAQNVKYVLVACGTVSAVALGALRAYTDLPVSGVVAAASDAAAAATRNGRVGIIGTSATVRSRAYERELTHGGKNIATVSAACPLFVPLVENGRTDADDIVVQTLVHDYLEPVKRFGADTLILGCTHYPLLRAAIESCMASDTVLIDSGAEGAKLAASELAASGSLCSGGRPGRLSCYISDSVSDFSAQAELFLRRPIFDAQHVDIDKY